VRWGGFGEDTLESALRICLRLALRARGKVREHSLAHFVAELPIYEGGEAVSPQVLLRAPELAICEA
jgi:hypothetical protein